MTTPNPTSEREAVANTASDQPVAPHVIRDSDGTVLSAYPGSVEWAVFKGHEGNGMAIISNCCDCRKPYLTWSVLSTMRCGDCRVTAARANERAQLAARATEQERAMVECAALVEDGWDDLYKEVPVHMTLTGTRQAIAKRLRALRPQLSGGQG